jgi:hypothetical protein
MEASLPEHACHLRHATVDNFQRGGTTSGNFIDDEKLRVLEVVHKLVEIGSHKVFNSISTVGVEDAVDGLRSNAKVCRRHAAESHCDDTVV